jgi:hypothetical protein
MGLTLMRRPSPTGCSIGRMWHPLHIEPWMSVIQPFRHMDVLSRPIS